MWILRQQDDAICATLDLLANIFGTVVEHSVSKGSSQSISAADAEVVQGAFLAFFLARALPGWPVAVAPGCQLLCRRQQQSPGGITLPKEKLQSLAFAVSAQLLQTAEDIKWILVEQNLVPSCCHYCRQYKGSERWLSAWHRRH
ncbi:uncharacterized protein LOC144112772 [Amblyomma americanum]